jgi:hypothetical protein
MSRGASSAGVRAGGVHLRAPVGRSQARHHAVYMRVRSVPMSSRRRLGKRRRDALVGYWPAGDDNLAHDTPLQGCQAQKSTRSSPPHILGRPGTLVFTPSVGPSEFPPP